VPPYASAVPLRGENERYRRLQAVTDAALSHLELDELLAALLVRVRDALEVDTCKVLLLDEETLELVPRAAVGIDAAEAMTISVPLGKGFAGRVAAERTPILLEDVEHAEVVNPTLREEGIKTLLGVQLLVAGEMIGVLHVGSLGQREFDDADIELLQLAADRAALAIRHAKVFEAERRARERLENVQRVTDVSLGRLELDDLLVELLIRAREILGLDSAAIVLDDDGAEVVRAFVGEDMSGVELVVPLNVRDQTIGTLRVAASSHVFVEADVHLLQLIAERVALAIEKSRLDDDTAQLDRLMLNFVAIASHELRTPASAVYGALATLRARADSLSPEIREQLSETAFEQSDRLRRLIEQLLDLSRLDAQSVRIEAHELSLQRVLDDVVRATSLLDADVVLEVDPELLVVADPLVIDRVVTNLVVNARSYGEPPIRIGASQGSGGVTIVVEDSGGGIPDELVARLFGRFERGREGHGSGLGLAIARAYANAHGGDLVYAAGDRGARFEFTLPRSV
jgi:signal transduction histidine kinase